MSTSPEPTTRRSPRSGVATLAGAVLLLAAPGEADAYLRDFQITNELLPASNATVQSHARNCPASKPLALNSGATGPTNSFLNGLGIEGRAGHIGGVRPFFAGEWAIRAQHTCATVTGTRPTLQTGAKYVTIVRSSTPFNDVDVKGAVARCPGGRFAIGAGFESFTYGNPVPAAAWELSLSGGSVRTFTRELVPSDQPWTTGAIAICADISTVTGTHAYPATLRPPSLAESPNDSGDFKYVSAHCPTIALRKTYVVGGGAEVLGAPGVSLPPRGVMLTMSAPATAPRATRWVGWAREHEPTDQPWRLRVRVVCATSVGHRFGLR